MVGGVLTREECAAIYFKEVACFYLFLSVLICFIFNQFLSVFYHQEAACAFCFYQFYLFQFLPVFMTRKLLALSVFICFIFNQFLSVFIFYQFFTCLNHQEAACAFWSHLAHHADSRIWSSDVVRLVFIARNVKFCLVKL